MNERSVSAMVVPRWAQIAPSANSFQMRAAMSLGRLKKNLSIAPLLTPYCQAPRRTAPSSSCQASMGTRLPFIALEHLLPEICPDGTVEFVEARLRFDIDEIARAR